jgi:hypothetical protein
MKIHVTGQIFNFISRQYIQGWSSLDWLSLHSYIIFNWPKRFLQQFRKIHIHQILTPENIQWLNLGAEYWVNIFKINRKSLDNDLCSVISTTWLFFIRTVKWCYKLCYSATNQGLSKFQQIERVLPLKWCCTSIRFFFQYHQRNPPIFT